jgi:plasmid stabilization system protein ParE
MLPVKLTKSAAKALQKAVLYAEHHYGKPRADALEEAFFASFDSIREQPNAWPKLSPLVREYNLERFPYVIHYVVHKDSIGISAIYHCKQHRQHY